MWVADAGKGKANPFGNRLPMMVAFHNMYPNTLALAWTSTGSILFFSEHTGWNHIYSITIRAAI
jgi:hypothetical protein